MSKSGPRANDILFVPAGDNTKSFDKYIEELSKTHYTTRTITLAERPSLANVMVMMHVMSEAHPTYEILGKQCYWYAGALMALLQEVCGVEMTEGNGDRAGTYSSVTITMTGEDGKKLEPGYKIAWEKYQTIKAQEEDSALAEVSRVSSSVCIFDID
jgi:hypothetical protein